MTIFPFKGKMLVVFIRIAFRQRIPLRFDICPLFLSQRDNSFMNCDE